MSELAVERLARHEELPRLGERATLDESGTVASGRRVGLDAAGERLGASGEIDEEGTRGREARAVLGAQDDSAAGSEDARAGPLEGGRERERLERAEAVLALLGEDARDALPGGGDDERVEVERLDAEANREVACDDALPGAAKSEQDDRLHARYPLTLPRSVGTEVVVSVSRGLACWPAVLVAFALCGACSSHPQQQPPSKAAPEDDYQDTDVNGRPIKSSTTKPAAAAPRAEPTPVAAKPGTLGSDGLPMPDDDGYTPDPKDPQHQKQLPPPSITLVYVCEIRDQGRVRPAAAIFSCDSESPYLNERPRPSRILKPLRWGKIVHLLAELKQAGLESLPVEEQKIDDGISGERQIIVIKDGKRVDYKKSATKLDKTQYETFAHCEKVLVSYSQGTDTFEFTEGLGPIPGH